MWEAKIFIVLWLSQSSKQDIWVQRDYDKAYHLPQRMLKLIEAYNARGASQINEIHSIRVSNEDTHPFEMGYVMSEILERYREMVGLGQRGANYTMDSVFETIKHTELIQKLFFEIFHLVNMFHEIDDKFTYSATDVDAVNFAKDAYGTAKIMLDRQKEIDKIKKIEKKKKQKQLKKERNLFLNYGKVPDKKSRKPKNKWWPIDYGWEIDYKWW